MVMGPPAWWNGGTMDEIEMVAGIATDVLWYVAHTRPRCEKKLVNYCKREAIEVTLPCFRSEKRYGRKQIDFEKPLFPGYVFFRADSDTSQRVLRNQYAANVLTVYDQAEFAHQLEDILAALESGCLVLGAIELCAGKEVQILNGPLAGMSGTVMRISNQTTVVLRLDFLGQGAAIVVDGTALEIIE
jgi:transcription antitermination factor NusG